MFEDNERIIIFECSTHYNLYDESGEEIASGKANAQISEDDVSILPKFGEVIFCALRDIISISENDYKIHLILSSNEKLIISNLGYKFEDFFRVLSKIHNDRILKDLLMEESIKKSGVNAEFIFFDENAVEQQNGKCYPCLYETAIVIIPEKGELKRIPYCDITDINEEDFNLIIKTDFGEKIIISKMGKKHNSFIKTLSEVINELSIKVQASLKELLPQANPSIIRKASRFMKEGKAAKRSDIESISPEIWNALEKRIAIIGIKKEYDFLKTLSQKEKICIGLKRDLLGDLTGEYMWFLIPIYSNNHKIPGNVVAMEAGSAEGAGKATYFFKLTNRKDYCQYENIDELHKRCDNFIKKINRCMLAINFRREPIYLSDEKISEPRYEKYHFAIQKISELRELRSLFIGRVIHSSIEQWEEDVTDLLKFNVSIKNDKAKWKKTKSDKANENNKEV